MMEGRALALHYYRAILRAAREMPSKLRRGEQAGRPRCTDRLWHKEAFILEQCWRHLAEATHVCSCRATALLPDHVRKKARLEFEAARSETDPKKVQFALDYAALQLETIRIQVGRKEGAQNTTHHLAASRQAERAAWGDACAGRLPVGGGLCCLMDGGQAASLSRLANDPLYHNRHEI